MNKTPGKAPADFGSLLQGSLQLEQTLAPAGDLVPPLHKNIEQLDEASRAFNNQQLAAANGLDGDGAVSAAYEQKARYILAGRGFNAEKLSGALDAMELKASYEPLQPLGPTNIEEYLSHHHDMIMVTAIEEAKQLTAKACDEHADRNVIQEWNRAKQELLQDMGYKNNRSEVSQELQWTSTQADMAQSNKRNLPHFETQPLSGSASVSGFTDTSRPEVQKSQLTQRMKQYAAVVKSLNAARKSDARTTFDAITPFVQIEQDTPAASNVDFLTCWKLARQMLHQGSGKSKYYTRPQERMYLEDYREGAFKVEQHFAAGGKAFLENQFYLYMQGTVKSAGCKIGGRPGFLPIVEQYLRLEGISGAIVGQTALWPQVYYCIRSGRIDDAIRLLVQAVESNAEPDDIIGEMVEALRDSSTSSVARITELFNRLPQSSGATAQDRDISFKKCVCNLLARVDPNYTDSLVVSTIEDFLWQRLYFCIHPASSSTPSSYSVKQMAETVLRFGSNHFDRDGKTPVVYFQILLLVQEFERAVEYVTSRGFHLEGVHFALVFHHYGALLTKAPEGEKYGMQSSRNGGGLLCLFGQGQRAGRPLLDFTLLVRQYVNLFSRSDKIVGAEYILLLRDSLERERLLVQILLDTRDFKTFIGKLNPRDGSRQQGLLDLYLDQAEVLGIVNSAARAAEQYGRTSDAVDLYMISSELAKVLSIFNTELSQVLRPPHSSREAWKGKAYEFVEEILSQNWAREKLTSNLQVGQTFQTLLNLMAFFDLVSDSKWPQAIEFLDSTNLMPLEEDTPVNSYFDLDDTIRNNFHHVMVAYMKCCSEQFKVLRSMRGANDNSTQNLVKKARLLVSFAGMIKFRLPEGTNETLNQMEVNML